MAETYCGKACADCEQKEQLNCRGCKSGPGRKFGGDCKIAKCAVDKGHEACDTCSFKDTCSPLRNRDNMTDDRHRKMEAEAARKAEIAKQAPVLGKWLWIVFWLIIPSSISGLMTDQTIVQYLPKLHFPGQIINTICLVVYGAALLKLTVVNNRYKKAGVYLLIRGGVSIVVALAAGAASVSQTPAWTLLLTIPAGIIGFVGEFNEYMGHSEVLAGVDNDLAVKWETLWKWYIGLFLGMLGCIVIMLIFPILGALALIGAAIGILVAAVLKLVYLYRTAKIFREYAD